MPALVSNRQHSFLQPFTGNDKREVRFNGCAPNIRPDDHLALTVEKISLPATARIFIRLMTAGVAVSYANNLCISGDRKMEQIPGIGYFPALAIDNGNIVYDSILTIVK
jgi:hypothetical protein